MAKVCKRNGRYALDYYFNGERIRKTLPKDVTKKEADAAMRDIQMQIFKGLYSMQEIPAFGKVCEEWLAYKKPLIRQSSFATYNTYAENHLSIFKTVKIQTMSTARIEAFISEKQASGANTETVRCIINVLNQIMKFAKKRGYIGYNPLADAEKPRGSVRSKGAIFDSDEINRLLNAESDPMYHCLFRLAVFSGAGAGELLALRWCDVLWDSKQIRIERSYNNGALYQPKNETSRRKITLGDGMMQTLREWRKSNLKSELVFPDKEGKFHNSMAVLRRFRKTLNQAGLPAIRFHDLRHSFASLMLSNGENIKVIQSQLGHSTPTMTLNVYSHLVKNEVVVFY